MTPVKLSVSGIYDADIEYSFESSKNIYQAGDAEKIKQCLGYAIFGNDALFKGRIILEFGYEKENCYIDRNFEANTLTFSSNGKLFKEGEAESRIAKIFRMSSKQWSEFAIADKTAAYEGTKADLNKYTDDLFENLGIGEDIINASDEEYKDKLAVLDNQMNLLEKFTEENPQEYIQRMDEVCEEIKSVKADSEKISESIGMAEVYKNAAEKIQSVKETIEEVKAQSGNIDEKKLLLQKSEEAKEKLELASMSESGTTDLRKLLEEKEEKLVEINAEIAAGEKALEQKQQERSDAENKVAELNNALDELIKESRETGKGDQVVTERLTPYVQESAETVEELKKIYKEKAEEKRQIEERLNEITKAWDESRLSSERRRAIRDGACFETAVKEKTLAATTLVKGIELDNQELETLEKELQKNEDIVKFSNDRFEKLFGGDANTIRTLTEDLNELERIKQSLYRNQILSAVLLQDVSAIEKRIDENSAMKLNCEESIAALENTQEAINRYVEKYKNQLTELQKEYTKVVAEKKYFENIDKLEYGSKCPVCRSLVSDKPDVDGKIVALNSKEEALSQEMQKIREIIDSQNEKSAKVNNRLGILKSTEKASSNYIESLNKAKITKLATLKKIYEENNVASHDELTSDLETAIREVANLTTMVVSVREIIAAEQSAKENIEVLNVRIDNLKNNTLPEKESLLVGLDADITKYSKEIEKLAPLLEDKTALSQFDDLIRMEKEDDQYYTENKELLAKRDELITILESISSDINAIVGNEFKYNKDGREYEYTDLCVSVVSDRYAELIEELRKNEEICVQSEQEIESLNEMLEEKQKDSGKIQAQYDLLKAKCDELPAEEASAEKETNIEEVTEETTEEPSEESAEVAEEEVAEEPSEEELKADDILDDQTAESYRKAIEEFETATYKYNCEIEALNEVMQTTKAAYDNLEENIATINELNGILDGRLAEYRKLSEKYSFYRRAMDEKDELNTERVLIKKKKSDMSNVISGTASDLLITKTNASLAKIMPEYKVKYKNGGLIVIKTKSGLETELEKLSEEEVIVVSIALIVAEKQLMAEVFNSEIIRIVCVQESLVGEEIRKKLREFISNNNLIILFNK